MVGYRRTGADFPFGNPLAWHGVSMEGYFWRLTDPRSARVVIGLVGINNPARGDRWATVGIAAEPDRALETGVVSPAVAHSKALGIRGTGFDATAQHLRLRVGLSSIDVEVRDPQPWPHRLFGGSSYFHLVPGLNQYWHPWLLGGRAFGTVIVDGNRTTVDGWQVYAEKNWGRGGFPESWWWGQAQGFADPDACVAFAGGQITAGPRIAGRRWSTEVTALVVRLPGGRVLRLGNPGTSPVTTRIQAPEWLISGRSARWRVELRGHGALKDAFVLPVPLVEERRNTPGDLELLRGVLEVRVHEWGREVWRGETHLAALELGGRHQAEAELAARGGDPRPIS